MPLKKLNLSFILKIGILVSFIFLLIVPSKSNIFMTADGSVCFNFNTADKKRTSTTYYRTIGITISRGNNEPVEEKLHPALQYVEFRQEEFAQLSMDTGGIIGNTFGIPASVLIAKTSSVDPSWGEEIQKALNGEGAVTFRADCIMVIHDAVGGWNFSKEYTHEAPLCKPLEHTSMDPNPRAIMNARGWSNKNGLKSHYNHWFILGGVKEIEVAERDVGEDYCITEYKTAPQKPAQGGLVKGGTRTNGTEGSPFEFATGNFSNEYNLRDGIPSGKSLTNKYMSSTYYLDSQVWARAVTDSKDRPGGSYADTEFWYSCTIHTRVWEYDHKEWNGIQYIDVNDWHDHYDPYDIRGTMESGESIFGIDYTDTLRCEVGYTYLVDANVYTLNAANIYNLAFGGNISYDYEFGDEVKVISTKDYQNIAQTAVSGEIDWNPDNRAHIAWGPVNEYVKDFGTFENTDEFFEKAKEQYKMDRADVKACAEKTVTRNDHLQVGSMIYVESEDVEGVHFFEKGEEEYTAEEFYKSGIPESAVNTNKYMAGTIEGTVVPTVEDEQEVYIPREVDNGLYSTGIECMFSRAANCDHMPKFFRAGYDWFHSLNDGSFYSDAPNQLTSEHCLDGYDGQIFVHTPVISPFSITLASGHLNGEGSLPTAEEKTQTVPENTNGEAQFQLLLDSEYVLDWGQMEHRNIQNYGSSTAYDSEIYSKYDEFVEKKWVKFPFAVVYNGKFYDATTADGYGDGVKYTKWIELRAPKTWTTDSNFEPAQESNNWETRSNNHWRKFGFYIPSFAEETGGPGKEASIKCLVEAYNVDGLYGGAHNDESIWGNNDWLVTDGDGTVSPSSWWEQWERGANYNAHTSDYAPMGARYVTGYEAKIQLSGIIYDFTITGTSDKDAFQYEDTGTRVIEDHVPFCSYKIEKKTGTKDRFGGNNLRYRIDGELEHNWLPINTIPLMAGKSNSMTGMGYVMKGSRFSYSFKTIANLDSKSDSIIIYPTFTYVRPNGSTTRNVKVYYHSPTSNEYYVEYGSGDDLATENTQLVQLAHKQFQNSFYDWDNDTYVNNMTQSTKQIKNWVNYSAQKEDITYENFMNRETPSFCLSYIMLPYKLRMLSGEFDQLKRNNMGNGRLYTGMHTYWDYEAIEQTDEGDWVDAGNNFAPYLTRFRDSMQTWFGQYYIPANLFIVDLDEKGLPSDFNLRQYAADKNGISDDDPIFTTNEGYLIINFDIRTKNEGAPHLQYNGGYNGFNWNTDGNMWATENQQKTINIDPNPSDDNPATQSIPLNPGDVAIVDMRYSIQDKYQPAIFNIN